MMWSWSRKQEWEFLNFCNVILLILIMSKMGLIVSFTAGVGIAGLGRWKECETGHADL